MKKVLNKLDSIVIKPIDIAIIFTVVLMICIVNITNQDLVVNPDLRFLYNRACQMRDCISDFKIPFFYYNDFGGVGYGSSFFYGDLTLYPFLWVVKFGISKFLLAYTTVTIVLTQLGVSCFAKRFTNNYKFISLIYICCCYTLQSFYTFGTYANLLAVAISFFFLAKCIDFFRDDKSFIQASILFYLILNTHTITALLSFLLCCFIMIMYFDKSKLLKYSQFACVTCLICSYFILNVIYHADILTNTRNINITMLDYAERGDITVIGNYISNLPFIGTLETIILAILGIDLELSGCKLFNIVLFTFLIVYFIRRLKDFNKKELITLILVIISIVVGERHLWILLNKVYVIPFQFPTRYMPYSIALLMIIIFRNINIKWNKVVIFIACLIDCLLISFMTASIVDDGQYTDLFCQVENGEYLDKSFVWKTSTFDYMSSHVTDQYGNEYNYIKDKDKLIVTVAPNWGSDNKEHDIILTFPKLYYNGYKLRQVFDDKTLKEIPLEKGYSQFIVANIGTERGEFILQYCHPLFLKLLFIYCNSIILYLLFYMLFRRRI